jgi:hypothetical protein
MMSEDGAGALAARACARGHQQRKIDQCQRDQDGLELQ